MYTSFIKQSSRQIINEVNAHEVKNIYLLRLKTEIVAYKKRSL